MGDSPGQASLGGGPAHHRPSAPGVADRPGPALPADGRGTGHPELVGGAGGQVTLEMAAV